MSKLIIINLKTSKNSVETSEYLEQITKYDYKNKVVILPSVSNLFLSSLYTSNIEYGVQDFYYKDGDSLTGAVNLKMLEFMNVKYALVGHHERRKEFKESNATINKKLIYALNNNVIPILCIGESLKQSENKNLCKAFLKKQLSLCLRGVKKSDYEKIIIAYEPTFAIGAESGANLEYVENNIRLIKELLSNNQKYNIKVLYGGSVNEENYNLYLESEVIDGVLVARFAQKSENLMKLAGRNE